jgi:hypothetical protein
MLMALMIVVISTQLTEEYDNSVDFEKDDSEVLTLLHRASFVDESMCNLQEPTT